MGVYVILAAGGLGFLASLLSNHGYKRIIKQIGHAGKMKHPFLTGIKKQIDTARKNNEEIKNIQSFLERQTWGCKTFGIRNESLESFSLRMAGFCLFAGLAMVFAGYYRKSTSDVFLIGGAAGCGSAAVLSVQALLLDFAAKRKKLVVYLEDYFCNVYIITEENRETFEQEKVRRRREIDYLKQSLDRIAAGQDATAEPESFEKPTKELRFSKEEEKILEEILKEYFA